MKKSINRYWVLPKPKTDGDDYVFRPVYKYYNGIVPWGYDPDPEDNDILNPDVKALGYLETAKKLLKKGYNYTEVSDWLTVTSGRAITSACLKKRVDNEQRYRRQAENYRGYQRIAEEAAKKAEDLEKRIGGLQVRVPISDFDYQFVL